MRDAVRHFVAEFIGIFALVFVGGAAIMIGADDTNAATACSSSRSRTDSSSR